MTMKDREFLELAAKAAGVELVGISDDGMAERADGGWWNPLEDDGDALRLVVILELQVVMHADWVEVLRDGIRMANAASEYFDGCMFATARAAIVRAAAKIGKSMEKTQ